MRLYSYSSTSGSSELDFKTSATIPTDHTKTVRAVAWAPSGKTFATASFDSNIGIWEQESVLESEDDGTGNGEWECAGVLEGHETECKCVAYSSSGTLLASCSRDKTVWIWEGEYNDNLWHKGILLSCSSSQSNRMLSSSASLSS